MTQTYRGVAIERDHFGYLATVYGRRERFKTLRAAKACIDRMIDDERNRQCKCSQWHWDNHNPDCPAGIFPK